MKKIAVAAFLCLSWSPVAWSCPSPLTGKDAAGTTQNFGVTLDGATNCYGNIAIVDGANAANKATVTAGNALKVDGSAVTQPVSGTVTATQGTPPWSVSQSGTWTNRIVGNAGGVFDFAGQNAAQPANSVLIGGEFNTAPTTIVSGNASPLQLDSAGNLLVNIKANAFGTITVSGTVTANQGTSPWIENVSQFGGNNVVTGTGASGAGIPRVTVANDSNVLATQSGTWTVQQGGAPWSVTIPQSNNTLDYDTGAGTQTMTIWGIALPASGGAVAGGTATNPIRVDPTGTTIQPVSGTVTANQGGAPWAENITQFGGVALSTGTGASGTGIPRVTVSNDSNVLATQSGTWTVQQGTPPWTVNPGTAANWGIGATGAAVPANAVLSAMSQGGNTTALTGTSGNLNVNIAASAATVTVSGTVTANQGGAPWSINTTQIAGSAISTAATGTQKVGVVGNTGAAMDAAGQNASTPANELLVAGQFNTTPTTITSGNVSPLQVDSGGKLLVNTGTVTVTGTVAATQSGTWTVQPGNTANTTPWLFSINQGGNTAAVNASSQLSVNCANCSGSGVSQQDLTGFTFGTTNMVPIGGVYSTSPSPIPSGQAAAARLTANRAIQDNPTDSAGREVGTTIAGPANALQVNQIATLNVQNTNQFAVRDAYNNPIRGEIITDGTDYADVISSTKNVGPSNGGLVVVPSPRLSLQCPFTVGISQTASTQIVTNPGGKALHVCGFGFVSASAQNVSLVEGTGATCATGTGALVGGTTASIAAAANGGLWNMTDRITIPMQKAGDNLCLLQSAAGNVSGTLTYGVF